DVHGRAGGLHHLASDLDSGEHRRWIAHAWAYRGLLDQASQGAAKPWLGVRNEMRQIGEDVSHESSAGACLRRTRPKGRVGVRVIPRAGGRSPRNHRALGSTLASRELRCVGHTAAQQYRNLHRMSTTIRVRVTPEGARPDDHQYLTIDPL